jgi:hypothetical protein
MFRFLVLWLCFVGAHCTALALSPADTTQSSTEHGTTNTITIKDTATKDTKRIALKIYMSASSAMRTVGLDYFLPNTPLVVTLQAGYNHAFNRNAAMGTANNQPGMVVRTGVSIFLFDRQAVFGF